MDGFEETDSVDSAEGTARVVEDLAALLGNLEFLLQETSGEDPTVVTKLQDTVEVSQRLAKDVTALLGHVRRAERPILMEDDDVGCLSTEELVALLFERCGNTVLVVEDDPEVAVRTERQLVQWGFEVFCAESFEEACVPSLKFAFALVDLDLKTDLTGYEVIRVLKSRDARPVVIAYSAYGRIEAVTTAVRSGADHFVVKPASMPTLISAFAQGAGIRHTLDREFSPLTLDEVKSAVVQRTYQDTGCNKTLTATRLGIDRKTVDRYLR